jgi:ABC-type lipoprotein release transport system permease subunit
MRSELRSTWRAVTLVVVLAAVGGGCALTALAGGRRTQTAMRRFVAYNQPEDASVFFDPTPGIAGRVLASPEVARTMRTPFLMVSPDPSKLSATGVFGAADDNALRTVERPMLLQGRLAARDSTEEVVVNDMAARQSHLDVGSQVTLYAFSREQVDKVSANGFLGTGPPAGPHFSVRVVGVVRQPNDIAIVPTHQGETFDATGSLYTTPAFVHHYARVIGIPFEQLPGNEIVRVQLRHGRFDLRAFTDDVTRIGRGHVQLLPGSDIRIAAAAVQRGTGVETIALWIFAALAAIATVILVALNVARMLRTDAPEHARLAALGLTKGQLFAVALARPALIAVAGSVLAVAFAIAASPLTPIGIARQAELHPGIAVNVAVLLAGFAALVLVLMGCAIVAALASTRSAIGHRRARRARHGARASEVLSRAGWGPAASLGVGSVWAPSDGGATPRRVAIVAIALATAGVAAAATFGTSLAHLVASPKQQGWNFDVIVGNPNDQSDQVARDAPVLARNRFVGGFSSIASPPETPTIDGHSVFLAGIEQRKGDVAPVILQGRFVRAPDEIVLGHRSLRALGKHLGDQVTVVAGPRRVTMRITGVMLGLSAGSVFNGRLDEGGTVTLAGLKRLEPQAFVTFFVVRFAPGVDRGAALASVEKDFGPVVLRHVPAQDVQNLVRVDALPGLLAALLVLLAVATLTHNLVASVRRGRRELATLKAIGFARAQLAMTVLWQTWALALIGVVVGIPAGVLLGRWAWRFVATQIGSVQQAAVPIAAVGIAVVVAAIIATVAAVVPALLAARVQPAAALRQE